TVTYNNAFGYQETDTTLGYDSFKLEAIEGVVVANEFANLYDTQVLAEGKTNLELAKDDVRSLNITSQVTDIGESRYAYVSGSTVYALENTGNNVVFEPEQGKKTDISTDRKFSDASGLSKTDDTEFYLNFGREGKFSCDYRLEFSVTFKHADAEEAFDDFVDISVRAAEADSEYIVKDSNGNKIALGDNTDYEKVTGYNSYYTGGVTYTKIIRANDKIPADDLKVIEGIFAAADNEDDDVALDKNRVTGDVYIGTKSTGDEENKKERDISNDISFRKFKAEYINSEIWDQDIRSSKNGEWLKIVDNDNDGKAEYAFLTEYWLDKAVSSYTKSGNTILEYRYLDVEEREGDDGIIVYEDEIAVGDIVLYTDIDNKIIIKKADTTKATINSVSFKDETATATDGTVYKQSGIYNKTRLDELLTTMDENVEYNLYFDAYGYVRAYEPAEGTKYGLVTELYYSRGQNGQYVTNARLTAELKAGKEPVEEFDVFNKSGNHFLLDINSNSNSVEDWEDLDGAMNLVSDEYADYEDVYEVNKNDEIVLQPALSHLSLTNGKDENGESRTAADIFRNVTTNVARYVKTADGEVRLTSAAEYYTNEKGQQLYYTGVGAIGGKKLLPSDGGDQNYPAYAVDYIELDLSVDGVAKKDSRYEIHDRDYANPNGYVNAVDDTEFYVVKTGGSGKITYFVGYDNVPAIDAEDIIAAYAVARNTESDSNKKDYWVADVIVIEVDNYDKAYESISLGYYNPYQTSGRVQAISSLNSETEKAAVDMIPTDNSWGSQWKDEGFYEVADSKMDGEDLMADTIRKITWDADNGGDNFSQFGIYAGYVRRVEEVNERGRYIDVNEVSDDTTDDSYRLKTAGAELFAIGAGSNGTGSVVRYEELHLANTDARSDIKSGHKALWVKNIDGDVAFIVDVSYTDGSWKAPQWLEDLWQEVKDQQDDERAGNEPGPQPDEITFSMKVKGVDVVDGKVELDYGVAKDSATTPKTYEITTNADRVVVDDGDTAAVGAAKDGVDLSDKADDGITYTITMTKGDVTRTETVKVTIKEARDDVSISSVTVKGVEAKLKTGSTKDYEVSLTSDQAASATTEQLVVGLNNGNAVSAIANKTGGVNITGLNTNVNKMTETEGKAPLAATGDFQFTITAEDGTTTETYTVAVTVGTKVTAPTLAKTAKSNLTGNGSTAPYKLTVPGGVDLSAAGVTLADYLTITDGGDTATNTAVVEGDTIKITSSKDGKETVVTTVTWENETITIAPTFNGTKPAGVTSAGIKKIVLDQTKTAPITIQDANGIITGWTKNPTTTLATLAANAEVSYTIDDATVTALDPTLHDGKTLVVDAVWKTDAGAVAAELSLSILISVE
ncbi:MAG: hypothetical protein K2O93_10100, partial [Oscillospiraceae bacterium]|nr:hypothetical protein [Oscillospiraceae bacterium]